MSHESAEARKIREDGDRTSRIRYCLQCIEDNIKCVENSTQDSFVQLETTGDSLLWNHQVLNYLKSFAPALKVVAEGINSISTQPQLASVTCTDRANLVWTAVQR